MRKEEYNGWFNYETWSVKLWQDNDQGSQEYWTEQAEQAYKNARSTVNPFFTKEERATLDLAESMKQYYDDLLEEKHKDETSVFTDMENSSWTEVNWHEIASHWIEDIDKDDDD